MHSWFFEFLYARPLIDRLGLQLKHTSDDKTIFRFLTQQDQHALLELLNSLEPELRGYFEVHDYSLEAINKQYKNKAFIMLGAYNKHHLIGYFFLRAGINKNCFVGRLVHKDYRLMGIGKKMSQILQNAAWESGYRVFATISSNNTLVIQSHKNNRNIKIIKELPNNYYLIEFVNTKNDQELPSIVTNSSLSSRELQNR